MADVTIYRDPAAVNVVVVDGSPPVDQSAQVASLTQQVSDLTAAKAALQAKIDAAKAALA